MVGGQDEEQAQAASGPCKYTISLCQILHFACYSKIVQ